MTPPKQDGRPLRSGTIKAEEIAADLKGPDRGLRPGGAPLTPAQQRALAEDKYPGEDAAPGYESGRVVVTDPNRPARPRDEAQPLDAWERIDGDRKETPAEQSAAIRRGVDQLRQEAQAHIAKTAARVQEASKSGDAAARARALADAEKAQTLGERVKKFVGV